MEESQTFCLLLDGEELQHTVPILQASKKNYEIGPESQAIGLLTIVTIGAAFTFIAKIASDLIERFKGGVVVDLESKPITVKRDKNLPYGYVLVVAKDGQATLKTQDAPKDSLERLLSELLKGAISTAKAAADKAVEILGKHHAEFDGKDKKAPE